MAMLSIGTFCERVFIDGEKCKVISSVRTREETMTTLHRNDCCLSTIFGSRACDHMPPRQLLLFSFSEYETQLQWCCKPDSDLTLFNAFYALKAMSALRRLA